MISWRSWKLRAPFVMRFAASAATRAASAKGIPMLQCPRLARRARTVRMTTATRPENIVIIERCVRRRLIPRPKARHMSARSNR
jgi:hypothetical protein